MNKNGFFLFLMLCLPLLFSCSDDSDDMTVTPDGYRGERVAVTFSAPGVTLLTRATDAGFEANDTISISVVNLVDSPDSTLQASNYADGVKYVSDGTKFMEVSDTIYQYKNKPLDLVYYAVYPHHQGGDSVFTFAVNADQSTHQLFSLSDLSMQKVASKDLTMELTLKHKLCNVEIQLAGTDLLSKNIAQPRLVNMCHSVQVNQSEQTVTTHAANAADTLTVINAETILSNNGAYHFHAIVAPQQIEANQHFVTIKVGGVDIPLRAANAVTLTSGIKYKFAYNLDNGDANLNARCIDVTDFE